MYRALFLHGGPGFNSCAESRILGPILTRAGLETAFWNEPSSLRAEGEAFRQDGAYREWVMSAQRALDRAAIPGVPVVLMAHSFAIHAALELADRQAERLVGLVALAPSLDLNAVYRAVLSLARADFARNEDHRADLIEQCLRDSTTLFDACMVEGLAIAAQSHTLFDHYWTCRQSQRATAEARNIPEAQFDGESFFAVLSDYARTTASRRSPPSVDVPILAVFGEDDPISPEGLHAPLLRSRATDVRSRTFAGASHYVHLEKPSEWIALCQSWLATLRQTTRR